jgi:hypothetical protein
LFTATIAQMSHAGHGSGDERWGNTHEVLAELFRAMDTDMRHEGRLDGRHRKESGIKSWADVFPFVNGGLFTGNVECPKFSRIARSYLLRAGELNWREINPDIFGSMIQAVADDDERGNLGMHYTSVPNILKVLNPLLLDDLHDRLEAANDNVRKLRNLRKRLASIRVFDPACGSGNFLVIAYLKMREIEHEIVQRTGDEPRSSIRLSNFYGIEIKSFAVEIARLSLLIAEFQADCRYLSQHEARAMVLPLHRTGQIVVGNALRLNWLEVCPPTVGAAVAEHDLAGPTGRFALNESEPVDGSGPQTFICGNPPYLGSTWQSKGQKSDLESVFKGRTTTWLSLDYVAGWFMKAASYISATKCAAAFVSTNSICQGQSVPIIWPIIFSEGCTISFAHTSFKWANLASNKAGVTVSVIGISPQGNFLRRLFEVDQNGETLVREGLNISPYLALAETVIVEKQSKRRDDLAAMEFGNKPSDGGNLLLDKSEISLLGLNSYQEHILLRRIIGSEDLIHGTTRFCIWIENEHLDAALAISTIRVRIESVRALRLASPDKGANALAKRAHQLKLMNIGRSHTIVVPIHTSENRQYLPVGLVGSDTTLTNAAFGLYDASLLNLALIASRLHLVWIATVCGKLETRYRYSNTLGWNTFPVPNLTSNDRANLTQCAENILLAREAHFPATIADLYDPDEMPGDLRRAHDANDEVLERIYIGRRFRNDTERLEKLFGLYTKTAVAEPKAKKADQAA